VRKYSRERFLHQPLIRKKRRQEKSPRSLYLGKKRAGRAGWDKRQLGGTEVEPLIFSSPGRKKTIHGRKKRKQCAERWNLRGTREITEASRSTGHIVTAVIMCSEEKVFSSEGRSTNSPGGAETRLLSAGRQAGGHDSEEGP